MTDPSVSPSSSSPPPPLVLATAEELNDLRKRVLAGEDFPAEEYRKILQAYRANRMGAVEAAAPKAKAKGAAAKAAVAIDLNTLMKGIGL